MRKPEYWEPDEVHEQYAEWLKANPPATPEPLTDLRLAVAKARGDILTDEDMKASINFLNKMAHRIKHVEHEPKMPESLELLKQFRDHIDKRIAELEATTAVTVN